MVFKAAEAGTGTRRYRTLAWLSLYAAAMAYLEAAVVVYLRRIHYPGNMLSLFPLKVWSSADLLIEVGREAATVIMILAATALAARGGVRMFAAFAFIFGLWDILYYAWLKVLIGWPVSWFEWDILFLIPWAWLGPWLAPAAVAALLAAWGGWVLGADPPCRFGLWSGGMFVAGILLVLTSFLGPAYPLLGQETEAVTSFRPGAFQWGVFGAGGTLMAAGLLATLSGSLHESSSDRRLPDCR
jgi:hypothetical protein